MWGNKCKACGAENNKKSSFCAQCGGALMSQESMATKCPGCGQPISSSARFCPDCGLRLEGDHDPATLEGRWARTEGDFATAMEAENLKDALKGGLIVEQGTHALLFHNGKYIDRLSPGRHPLASVGDRLSSIFSKSTAFKVVLADAGVAPLKFMVDGLKTADPLFIKLECEIMVRIEDPDLFYLNLFKQRRNLGVKELSAWLLDELRNALREEVKKVSVKDIFGDRDIKDRLAIAISQHLKKTFTLYGLVLVQCRTLSISHPRYNALEAKEEDLTIEIWDQKSSLSGRKRLFEHANENDLQGIYEATKRAELEEKKIEVYPRIRKAIMTGQMDKVRSEQELAAFLNEIDTEKMLRTEEKDELIRAFAEKKEDHRIARDHLLSKLGIEQKVEQRRLELMSAQALEHDVLDARLKTARLQFEYDLNQEQEINATRREEALKNNLKELQIALAAAKNQKEITLIELEIKQKKSDLGMANLERIKAIKIKTKKEEMLIEAERQDRALALTLKEKDQQHKQKLEEIQAFSGASTEAILATADLEKSKIISELKKTELLGGWSEDKILAAAAANSPEVAKAFEEKFKGMNANQAKELYERMLGDKDQMLDKYRDEQKDTRADLKDITMAAIHGQKPVSQVVYPPPGGGRPDYHQPTICPNCGEALRSDAKFCVNCGAKT